MIFILVGVNRATESRDYLPETQRVRTPQAALDAYANFNSIVTRGDFDLEIVQDETYSVTYQPLNETAGSLNTSQSGQTLSLEGFGNRNDTGRGKVTITLPALDELSAYFHTEVSVSGFSQDILQLAVRNGRTLVIAGNTLGTLEINADFLQEIRLEDNVIANEQLSINDRTVINR
jgi:hypothetical protein